MRISGLLRKLQHRYGHPIAYSLELGEEAVDLNSQLGNPVTIAFERKIQCIVCGREIKKTYNGGYCYPCFRDLPENDLCIVKPSECHFQAGTCRDENWGKEHCMQPHYVYLAVSSDVKVGITRKDNEIRRWTDQGAVEGAIIAEVPTRKMAGELEIALARCVSDRTDWRRMLRCSLPDTDLHEAWCRVYEAVPEHFKPYLVPQPQSVKLWYPMLQPAKRLKSFNLLKQPLVRGRLIGVKGQYLVLDQGVFNVRKHAGFHLTVAFGE